MHTAPGALPEADAVAAWAEVLGRADTVSPTSGPHARKLLSEISACSELRRSSNRQKKRAVGSVQEGFLGTRKPPLSAPLYMGNLPTYHIGAPMKSSV